VIAIDVGDDIAEKLVKERIEFAFLALHGKFGEDGTVQGMLELMKIPYTGSGVLASALAMDKIMSKKFFLCEKIPTLASRCFDGMRSKKINRNRFLFLCGCVKPAREGSTIGISIVRKEEDLSPL